MRGMLKKGTFKKSYQEAGEADRTGQPHRK
ncbi:hypothetical protein Pla175_12760 [Pirellulimonas nuda]|uniref:Uncharacterized protein n=1 Tax=Pirellulimonas nuda TaxID=2528009 RepID=A0A518D8V2_9BACT|nr:hypothetical protein Pla175_12760 [Pirellulimonas nuda]